MDYGGAHNNHSKAKSGAASKQKHVKFKIRHSPTESQDSPDTFSPSLSDSSSDDYIQVNPKILPKFRVHNNNKPPLSNGPQKSLFYENDDIDLPSEALYRMEESINGESSGSTSRFSDITHESLMPQLSPTQSPPMQFMDKTGGFEPARIPHSVFSKSSTPTEWSVTSNDSLFSIRIGDGSFSRDRVSSEVLKPEELAEKRLGEGELITSVHTPSPVFKGIEPHFDIEETISAKPEEIRAVEERIGNGPTKGHIDTVKSEIRVQHFVKTVKKKSLCLPCYCGDCFRSLCVCKSLSCLCKWPNCSFKWCVWPGCCGICSSCRCKCPEFPICCCKCPNWSSCCCKFPNWSSCCKCSSWSCCKCLSCSECSPWSCCKCSFLSCFKCSSWSCCKCSSWSCFKCSSWSCCKCSSWSCFKCSSWSCCKCSSWSCFKCSSWSCFKCSSWSCFQCLSCSCFQCSSWSCFQCSSCSCCKCQCSSCTWACCYCWNREQKTSSYDSPTTLTDGGTTNSKSSTNASPPQRKSSCFSCSSSCSCCACWSCSCCC